MMHQSTAGHSSQITAFKPTGSSHNHSKRRRLIATAVACLCLLLGPGISDELAAQDETTNENNAGELAKAAWTYADGFSVDLWADESLISFPTAISFDDQGRLFIAVHFRNRKGTEDNRMHKYWMDDDFAARTVDDRLAMYKKWAAEGKQPLSFYSEHADQIHVVSDSDGDGRADKSVVYAEFADALDGALAGLLARPDGVWVTNIPHLWKLTGENEDGTARVREKVHSGFGVKVSLHGHDMHGIIEGPDGRLYWSIGDRGYHVRTKQGRVLEDAYSGAVFRCERDGSGLEVFATGLRNPQELAFDDFGNLFTVDNDADGEDRARLLYLVEGGEYGWRMTYQWPDEHRVDWAPYIERPWWRESVWDERPTNQAMYVMPPIGHITEGPCGLAREPGLSTFSDKYRGAFFVSDFRGVAARSQLWSFRVQTQGAGFRMSESESVASGLLPTDIEFGHDGCLYVADYGEGWAGTGEGRIWRMTGNAGGAEGSPQGKRLAEVKRLLELPTKTWASHELIDLLGHPHQGVRQRAQFESALRPKMVTPLTQAAIENDNRMARLHALWALGQMQRSGAQVLEPLISLLADADEEVRTLMARLLRDTPISAAAEPLRQLLRDPSKRVASIAAMALGRLGDKTAIPTMRERLTSDSPTDDFLRHAVVVAFTDIAEADHLEDVMSLSDDDHPEVRLAVLLALRRMKSPEVASFLADEDPRLVLEAARAINDVPITAGLPALAKLIHQRQNKDIDLGLRVLNANFRLGGPSRARNIAKLAADSTEPELLRQEALAMLAEWPQPSPRERIVGTWQPLKERKTQAGAAAAVDVVPELIRNAPTSVRKAAVALAQHYDIDEATNELLALVGDETLEPADRAVSIRSLAFLDAAIVADVTRSALNDPSPDVRAAGRDLIAVNDPDKAMKAYEAALKDGEIVERRGAMRQLGRMKQKRGLELLAVEMEKLAAGELPPALELDALLASEDASIQADFSGRKYRELQSQIAASATRYRQAHVQEALAEFRPVVHGGTATFGRNIFLHNAQVQCLRCHRVDNNGTSRVGPDLSDVGRRLSREQIVESIVKPSAKIAKGYEQTKLLTADGRVISGIIGEETNESITILPINLTTDHAGNSSGSDAPGITIPLDEIEERVQSSKSGMPDGLHEQLSLSELRDLVEFLATRRTQTEEQRQLEKRQKQDTTQNESPQR
ncbi:MAG: c-type cytochrome [Gammaproteobacteria bacterium]|nr:c-type cytochrome [Gammaproteobacteria bacterium]